jgi:rhodanese-related sulfurtransferase
MTAMLFLLVHGCATSAPETPAPPPSAPVKKVEVGASRNVTASQLKAALDAKSVPLLVDVRTTSEFEGGHVPGAKNIPIDELGGRVSELAAFHNGPIYVICASGGRSARGAALLATQGYDAVNVSDGTSGWVAAGLPVEQ